MKNRILSYLPPEFPWRDNLHWFDTIGSTNDRAKQMARSGAPHGTVLIADRQTGGRGRRGRSFHSPEGMGIYMSVILRPNCPPGKLMHLTCAAAEAMCGAVERSAGFRPGIKWTNDLVFQKRKLGGILTELILDPRGGLDCAIIGIGINCRQTPGDFPPELADFVGSLTMVSGREIDRAHLAAAMMEALLRMDANLLTAKAGILRRYRADCVTLGQDVVLIRGEEKRYAHALDIDEEGALVLRFSSGETQTVNSGEVSIRGMYGYI